MMKTLVLLLFAASALGQPVVGPEAVSAPIEGLGELSLAPQRDGFLIAWEAAGRIYAGRLDSSLQLTGAPLQLPLSDARETATAPSIATNGSTVLVAWHEHADGWPDWNAVATLTADAGVLLSGPRRLNLSATPAVTGTANGNYVVYSDELKYGFDDSLEQTSFDSSPRGMSSAISDEGAVGTATHDRSTPLPCIHFYGIGESSDDCVYQVMYTFRTPAAVIKRNYPVLVQSGMTLTLRAPKIGPNGGSFASLVLLPDKTDLFLLDTAASTRLPFTILEQVDLAGNGKDVLIVRGGSPMQGFLVHSDLSVSPPFVIAEGSIDEPHVVATGSNDFVVFYRKDTGVQQKVLAGRVIHLQPSKRRALR